VSIPAIRKNLDDGVATATRIVGHVNPRWPAVTASTEQIINMACAVAALDTVAGAATDLLGALDDLDDAQLPPKAALARQVLTRALVSIGYVTLANPAKPEIPNG